MPWYHGTVRARLEVGNILRPAAEIGRYSNIMMNPRGETERGLASGRTVNMHEVVWVTSDPDEAAHWAEHSLLKSLPSEIRRSPAGGVVVYEVTPRGLDYPTAPHVFKEGAQEAVCASARIIREVSFEAFILDECDGGCGEKATIGLGTDNQLCADCAAYESAV